MATITDARCVHCSSVLSDRDLSEGWCDSCGKRLPGGGRPAPAAKLPVAVTPPEGEGGRRGLLWGLVAVALIGAGAAAAFAAAAAGS
jgi:hypothetical protein